MDTTSAPAASAFRHSVAAALPAPTTTTRGANSCGSDARATRRTPPRTDDDDARRELVRLVRMDDARIARELLRDRQPRVAVRDEHVPVRPPGHLEPARDCADLLHALGPQRRVPARRLPHAPNVRQE